MQDFYDGLSAFYHLIYPNWHASIDKQGAELASLIRERWGSDVQRLLDVSCGIGTQALGLASQGFDVVASDLSKESIARARSEAKAKRLEIPFSVCDMREIQSHHQGGFDVVMSADNSIPHLLTDEDIVQALKGMYGQLKPGGGCLITVRDYEQVERGKGIVKPYGVREENGVRYLIWQVWDFEGDIYNLSMYFVEDDGGPDVATHVMRSRYYAISTTRLLSLMQEAGFEGVERIDGAFFQPVLVGQKSA